MTQSTQYNGEIKVDILDYIGKHEDGILVLLSLGYKEKYYEATFFYTQYLLILTPSEELEKELGSAIEDWVGYNNLMLWIISRVVPYEEMIKMADNFNPEKWGLFLDKK
jgi:hypothetical protein